MTMKESIYLFHLLTKTGEEERCFDVRGSELET